MKKALIIGAGIGGLSAAIALGRKGWQVKVLEQAQALQELGAGIQISPNASRVLAKWQILKTVASSAFSPEALEMRWGLSGRRIFKLDIKDGVQARWQAPYLHVHRADLITALADELHKLQPDAVMLGAECVAVEQSQNWARVRLANGKSVDGDVLLAADGVHSRVRAQIFGEPQAVFSGHVAWRMVVPMDKLNAQAPPPTACVWAGPKRHAVTYQLRRGELANFVGVVETQEWDSDSWSAQGDKQDALRDFAGWHPCLTQMIDQADVHHRWALLVHKPLKHWHRGRIGLLGDACHPMLPFMAQGAAMAIEDADTLAECLDSANTIETGLAQYFLKRIHRTSTIQALSGRNAKRFHQAHAAYYLPLYIGARLFPTLALRSFDSIYQHPVAGH